MTSRKQSDQKRGLSPRSTPPTVEGRRLAELAMAAGFGSTADDLILRSDRESLALLGADEDSPLLADVLRWQGSVLRDRGQTTDAEKLYVQSLAVAQKLHYEAGQAHALNCLGSVAQRRGDLVAAHQYFNDARRIAEVCGEGRLAGMIQQNLGVIADIAGDSEAAFSHYHASLHAFESTHDSHAMTLVLNNLGVVQFKSGRHDDARSSYDRALTLARYRGDLLSEGVIEENVAELELRRGKLDAAVSSIDRALEVAELRQDRLRRAAALKLRGSHLRLSGRPADALEPLRTAMALSAVAEDALLGGEIMFECGLALAGLGREAEARQSWSAALDAFDRIGAQGWVDRVNGLLDEAQRP
ncbi:MAG: tetratricopeptide repeat protein [Gemmatimonadaceae bacterium]